MGRVIVSEEVYYAVIAENIEVVELLIKAGADLNKKMKMAGRLFIGLLGAVKKK